MGKDTHNTGVSFADGNVMYIGTGEYSDPSAWLDYIGFTEARNMETLTTDDFRYTVIRYRTSMTVTRPTMELFILTGDAESLMDMIRIQNSYSCHSGAATYANSRTWRGVVVDLAEDDGRDENTQLLYGWQGREVFKGFRFDWCEKGSTTAYFEVSDFMFYADREAADGFANAINTLSIFKVTDSSDGAEDTYETEHIVMPWETESDTEELTTEETVPQFTEDTTEEDSSIGGNETEQTETSVGTEWETETQDTGRQESNQGGQSSGGDNFGGIDISGGEEEPGDTGSQMPFVIACVALAGLSVASIVTVIVIRIKDRA